MPALKATDTYGTITWLGFVPNRALALPSQSVSRLSVGFDGPQGEDHAGLVRPSCSRVASQHKKGTPIRNVRQLSVLGAEDLADIANKMGIDGLDPALVGATMVISGIPDFSHIPPSARLQNESGATIVVDMENRPCMLPAKPIEAKHPGFGARFKSAALGKRGVTAWVEAEGAFQLGDKVRLHIPDQPVWAGKKSL